MPVRVTILSTWSNSCNTLYEDLLTTHQATVIAYDVTEDHDDLPRRVIESDPDWVLLIGCHDSDGQNKKIPSVFCWAEIGKRYPLVHLCCDGAEEVWWGQLARYYDHGRFALQVNIDGVKEGPIGDRGLVTLCPINPAKYQFDWNLWAQRPVRFGFCGGWGVGHPRFEAIETGVARGLLTARKRDDDPTPDRYREFLMSSRCIYNHPLTGSADKTHVKARIIEGGCAGGLLFEQEGSVTEAWFQPQVHYFTYESWDEIEERLRWVDQHPDQARVMAQAMHGRIVREHSSDIFWKRVIEHMLVAVGR